MSGGKQELTERVAYYLETAEMLKPVGRTTARPYEEITLDTIIEENIRCSEKHRQFFKDNINERFKFNVEFINWLRENPRRTYRDAVDEYHVIMERKKTCKPEIGKQFEYNTYIRDFFQDNKGLSLSDAIICWKHKRSIPGHNRYEPADKIALEKYNDKQT